MSTRVTQIARRLTGLLAVVTLASATVAPGALGNSIYTVPVDLSFDGTGTYFVHYTFDDTAKGGCTSDTTATLSLSWKDRNSFGDYEAAMRPAASGAIAIRVVEGPGTFKVKGTETAGDNCSVAVHPSCHGDLKAGHDPSGLSYSVPAVEQASEKDVFTWQSPFKLDTSVHCDGTNDQSDAGFAGGAMKIFNESVASTITAKLERDDSDVISGNAFTETVGQGALDGSKGDCTADAQALLPGPKASCTQTLTWTGTVTLKALRGGLPPG